MPSTEDEALTLHQFMPVTINCMAGLPKEGGTLLPIQVVDFPDLILNIIGCKG